MRLLTLVILVIICILPATANAQLGFITGLSIGSMMGGHNDIIAPEGIPPICVAAETFDDFAKCRLPSASIIPWVTDDEFAAKKPGRFMGYSEFINREWSLITKLKSTK